MNIFPSDGRVEEDSGFGYDGAHGAVQANEQSRIRRGKDQISLYDRASRRQSARFISIDASLLFQFAADARKDRLGFACCTNFLHSFS